METLKELALRAQIPQSEADEVIRILHRDDGGQPNFDRADEDYRKSRQLRDKLVDANVFNTPT